MLPYLDTFKCFYHIHKIIIKSIGVYNTSWLLILHPEGTVGATSVFLMWCVSFYLHVLNVLLQALLSFEAKDLYRRYLTSMTQCWWWHNCLNVHTTYTKTWGLFEVSKKTIINWYPTIHATLIALLFLQFYSALIKFQAAFLTLIWGIHNRLFICNLFTKVYFLCLLFNSK